MIRYAVQHTAITTAPITRMRTDKRGQSTLAINLPWFAVARFSNLIAITGSMALIKSKPPEQ